MREYENADRHFKRHMSRSAERYAHGLQKAGLKPNATLTRAIAERALEEATNSYLQETYEIRDHNLSVIINEHKERLNQIKREGARLRLWMCPPIAALFGFMAWYSFIKGSFPGSIMGTFYTIGALAFLGMLVLGGIFDRPR